MEKTVFQRSKNRVTAKGMDVFWKRKKGKQSGRKPVCPKRRESPAEPSEKYEEDSRQIPKGKRKENVLFDTEYRRDIKAQEQESYGRHKTSVYRNTGFFSRC